MEAAGDDVWLPKMHKMRLPTMHKTSNPTLHTQAWRPRTWGVETRGSEIEAHPWPQIEANRELHDSLSQNNNRKQRVEEEEKMMPSQDSPPGALNRG